MNDKNLAFFSGKELQRITQGILKGEEKEFDVFYDVYSQRLYNLLFYLIRGKEEICKDIHQETLIRIIRYMKVFDDEKYFWNWQIRILKSTISDYYRRTKISLPESVIDEKVDFDQAHSYLIEKLNFGIKKLNDEDRELIEAHYFQKLSFKKIAGFRHSTQEAIAMKVMRIRKNLKKIIKSEFGDET